MLVSYKGISPAAQKEMLNAAVLALTYPKKRGVGCDPFWLSNDERKADNKIRAKEVEEKRKDFKNAFIKDMTASIDKLDVERQVAGRTFKKGVAVDISKSSADVQTKIKSLIEVGVFEVVEKKGKE